MRIVGVIPARYKSSRFEGKPLAEANEWLEGYRQIWEGSFRRLDALLDELKTQEKKRGHAKH